MTITYTNRKDVTYYLCRGVTKTGKPRYYFAREPKGEPVEEIPPDYKITESVNGIVSLAKDRPSQILPEEVAAVEAAIQKHPEVKNYRVDVKGKQILVYERVGGDLYELRDFFEQELRLPSNKLTELSEVLDRHAQFSPILRFTLHDEENRTFGVERMCYLGSIDDWIQVGTAGSIEKLARETIPKLGTDAFFGLW